MRIMIVEDEVNARTVMAAMIRSAYPDHEVKEYASPVPALSDFRLQPFDVVLTDIQMPEMDGLAMTEAIRATGSECPIVIISAYDQFYYAQRALKQRAFDYILKPFDRQSFLDAVRRALESAAEAEQAADAPTLERIVRDGLNVQAFQLFEDTRLCSCVARSQRNWDRIRQDFNTGFAECTQALPVPCSASIYEDECGRSLMIIAVPRSEAQIAQLPVLPEALSVFVRRYDDPYRYPLRLSSGGVYPPKDVRSSLGEAQAARLFAFYDAFSPILTFRPFTYSPAILTAGQIEKAAQEGENAVRALLDRTVRESETSGKLPGDFLRESDEELARYLTGLQNALNPVFQIQATENRARLRQERSAEAWIEGTAGLLAAVGAELSQSREDRNAGTIEACIDYIRSHYTDANLTLRDISDAFHFNHTYFSSLFKKQMGMTIVQYLTQVRIEAAKDLVLNTDLRLADIARRTGFNDLHYFMRVFKANVGMTPSDFKRRGGGK